MKWYWPISTRRQLAKLKKTPSTTTKIEPIAANDPVVEKLNENLLTIDIDAGIKLELAKKQIVDNEEEKPLKDLNIRKVYEQRLESFLNSETQPSQSNVVDERDNEEKSDEEKSDDDGVYDEEEGRERYMESQVRLEREKKTSDNEASSDDDDDVDERLNDKNKEEEENEESDFEQEINELAESNLLYNQELIKKKIDMICMYLRDKYLYCVWCGTRFDDAIELEKNCPGLTEPDHDES